MKMTLISCILMVPLLLPVTSDVMASDFSYGSKIITINDYKYAILRECGEPSDVEVWKEVRIKRDFGSRLLE
jgi:hypothetical protein